MNRIGWATAGVVAIMGATVALVATTAPSPAERGPAPGLPLVREVHLAGQHLPVLITPHRPGTNLVLVGGESSGIRVGRDPDSLDAAADRPGTTGKWTTVDLPPGPGEIWLEYGGARTAVDVDPGHAPPATPETSGPDGPECASAALGAALANHPREITECPADALSPGDAASLRALVDWIAGRGVHAITIAADGSARAGAATAAVREVAAARRLSLGTQPGRDDALLVLSGWAAATNTLSTVASQQRTTVVYSSGTYLAPWLLTAPVLATTPGAVLPLRFDPRDDLPVRYEAALAAHFHGLTPTASGYLAWQGEGTAPTRLYAASRVSVLPADLGAHRHGHDAGWLPGGTIVAVTGNLA